MKIHIPHQIIIILIFSGFLSSFYLLLFKGLFNFKFFNIKKLM